MTSNFIMLPFAFKFSYGLRNSVSALLFQWSYFNLCCYKWYEKNVDIYFWKNHNSENGRRFDANIQNGQTYLIIIIFLHTKLNQFWLLSVIVLAMKIDLVANFVDPFICENKILNKTPKSYLLFG